MLLLGNFGISGIDNILRPMLISGQSQLNGLLAVVSALGGLYAFGFVGIVLGPMLAAVTVGMVKGYHESLAAGPETAPPDAAPATPPESRTEPPPEPAEPHPTV
jgi:predicted PurR-regulated permease PerM